MLAALKSLWRGIAVFERYGHVFVTANIVAAILSLPIITLPLAFAGLCRLGRAAHVGPSCHIDDFWSGVRAYLGQGIVISIASIAIGLILYVNYTTYVLQSGAFFVALRIMWLSILTIWIGTVLYLFPLLERMERPDLWLGLRNAATMVLKNPFFSALILLGVLIISTLSTLLVVPWALISLSMLASIATAAVDDRLKVAGVASGEPQRGA